MRRSGSLLLWGFIAVLAVLCALPLLHLIVRALGLEGGVGVLGAKGTTSALWKSLALAATSAAVALVIALPAAWLSFATDVPWRRVWRVLLVLPLAVPSYVGAYVVLLAFGPGGLFPGATPYGFWGTVLALAFTYPLAFLALQAALARVDPRQWEAARSLGLSPWRAFWRVVFPHLRPALGAGALLVGLYAIGDFGAVALLKYDSLSHLIYLRQKSLFDADEAIFLALLLVALSTLLVVVFAALGGRAQRNTVSERRVWPVIELGRFRWPAFAFLSCLGLVFLLAPVGLVSAWLIRGFYLGHELSFPTKATWTSFSLGAVAAFVIVGLAFVPALVRGRAAGWLVRVTGYAGYALPGIVVALAMVSMATSWAEPLYQTSSLLILAYVIRYFPLATSTISDSVDAQSGRLVDAARSLGASPLTAFARVTLPIARPAVIAAGLAVFIAVIKELPATLILSPLDFKTLATDIWDQTENAYLSAAAISALLLLVLATIGLLVRSGRRVRTEGRV